MRKVPRLPDGLAASREAEGLYHQDLNRYLVDVNRDSPMAGSGSWTPTLISIGGTNPTVTYAANNRGVWQRIGSVVMVSGQLNTTAVSGGSGSAGIGGLPFACANDVGAKGTLVFGNVSGFSSSTSPRSAILLVNTATAPLWRANSADARDAINTQVTVAECVTPVIFFQGLYFV